MAVHCNIIRWMWSGKKNRQKFRKNGLLFVVPKDNKKNICIYELNTLNGCFLASLHSSGNRSFYVRFNSDSICIASYYACVSTSIYYVNQPKFRLFILSIFLSFDSSKQITENFLLLDALIEKSLNFKTFAFFFLTPTP